MTSSAFLTKGPAMWPYHPDILMTSEGLPYSQTIAAIFDAYRQNSPRRFSSTV